MAGVDSAVCTNRPKCGGLCEGNSLTKQILHSAAQRISALNDFEQFGISWSGEHGDFSTAK